MKYHPGRLRAARLAALGALVAALSSTAGSAQQTPGAEVPQFADVFGTGMVLPHGRLLDLRGQAALNQRLRLQVGDSEYILRSDARGAWRQQVKPLRAGGPYTLVLSNEAVLACALAAKAALIVSGRSRSARSRNVQRHPDPARGTGARSHRRRNEIYSLAAHRQQEARVSAPLVGAPLGADGSMQRAAMHAGGRG